jgi:hypothetical protein
MTLRTFGPPWLLPALLLVAWLSVLAFILPYDVDEAVYAIVAGGIVDGQWPYRDLFDHKPPVLYALYLPAGLGASIEFERVLAALCVVATFPFLWQLANRWLPEEARIPAIVAYALLLANPFLMLVAHPEPFLLLPLVASIASRSAWRAGALFALAVAIKPVVIILAPMLLFAWRGEIWKSALAGLGVAALVLAPFLFIWADFWEANVAFNLRYIAHDSRSWTDMLGLEFSVVAGSLAVWIVAACGLTRRPATSILLWFACSLLAIKLSGRDYAHYWVLLAPPAALLAGLGWTAVRSGHPRTLAAVGVAAFVGVALGVSGMVYGWQERDANARLVAAVGTVPGELYVAGDSDVYVLAERAPQRRVFYPSPMLVDDREEGRMLAELRACPPAATVLQRPAPLLETLDWEAPLAAIYRRKQTFENAWLFSEPRVACDQYAHAEGDQP